MRWSSALLSGALVLGLAGVASATVMVRASVEELTRASERVVYGRVAAARAREGGPRGEGGIFTRVELEVDETWRGPSAPRAVLWVHGGRVGERAMRVHGQATFEPGERVVVFLSDAGGAWFPTGMSQGKWRVEGGLARSAADEAALVTRGPDGLEAATAPAPMSLDALRARVRGAR
ncbi:MAG: hypothetical protein KF729_08020 [Sandaracinaceae bacterium]|nr:hypothetical protein [Sandaracinaceae bacterium]